MTHYHYYCQTYIWSSVEQKLDRHPNLFVIVPSTRRVTRAIAYLVAVVLDETLFLKLLVVYRMQIDSVES